VIYARESESGKEKPDPGAYSVALHKLGVKAEETVCVGDNPHTDFWGAKQLGIVTFRLLCGEFKDVRLSDEFEAEVILDSLSEVMDVLERINH
jgi:putative hydrolase of the HAD superfamily